MKKPAFSVLVSSFNYRDYVVETVRSALNQTYPPAQIIVVDDGSSDDSVQQLRNAFSGNSLVSIIAKDNGGQLSAWIEGFRHVRGGIVALLDSDDLWEPTYLERNAAIFTDYPSVDYVFCNMQRFGARSGLVLNKRRHRRSRDLGLSMLMGAFVQRWQGVATSGNCIRRNVLQQLLSLPADQVPEWKSRPDDCLFYGSDILGAHKYYLADVLVRHREHPSNALLDYSTSPLKRARYAIRAQRMLDYYQSVAGISRRWLRLAKYEFRTKPKPSLSEWFIYMGFALSAPTRFVVRLNQMAVITTHYVGSWFTRA